MSEDFEICAEPKDFPERMCLTFEEDFTLNARSRTDQLPRLFDGNIETTYQSDASCPHWIDFIFTKPIDLHTFMIYRREGDGSYMPERISLTVKDDSSDEKVEISLPRQTGFVYIPFEAKKVSTVRFAVERNHSGGCDTKIRQMAFFRKVRVVAKTSREFQKCLLRDLEALSTDTASADLLLQCAPEGSEPVLCHSSIVVPRSGYIAAALDPKVRRDGKAFLELPLMPRGLVELFVQFCYKGARAIAGVFDSTHTVADFHVPPLVSSTFGPVASIYSLARYLLCDELSASCEDFIVSRAVKKHPRELWQWLSSVGTDDVNRRVAEALASNRQLLVEEHIHHTLTPRQLRYLVQYSLRRTQASAVVKKGTYVKLKLGRALPGAPPPLEVGVVAQVTRKDETTLYTVNFPSRAGVELSFDDIVVVDIVEVE